MAAQQQLLFIPKQPDRKPQPVVKDWQEPPPATSWRLRRRLCRLRLNDQHNTNVVRAQLEISKEFFAELESIKCLECDGYGHATKKCPTRAKVVKFCYGNKYTQTFVNQSRTRMYESYGP